MSRQSRMNQLVFGASATSTLAIAGSVILGFHYETECVSEFETKLGIK